MPPGLGTLDGEYVARGFRQPERGDLVAIGVRLQAEAVRDRQARVPQRREIGGLGTEARGVGGCGGGERNYEFIHLVSCR